MNYRPGSSLQDTHRKYIGGNYNQCEGQRNLGRCVANVNENQSTFSKRVYGKVLCWSCQQLQKGGEK